MICCGLIVFLILNGKDLISQPQTIFPDQMFQSHQLDSEGKDVVWLKNGTAFCTYNGDLFMFVWTEENGNSHDQGLLAKRYYPYVYSYMNGDFQPYLVNGSNKLVFGYLHEDDWYLYHPDLGHEYDLNLIGKAFAFVYNDRLWFWSYIQNPIRTQWFIECWAQLSVDGTSWDCRINETFDAPPVSYKVGAVQAGEALKTFVWNTQSNTFSVEEFRYDNQAQWISYHSKYGISLPGNMFGSVINYRDANNNDCYVYSTYIPPAMGFISFESPVAGWYSEPFFSVPPGVMTLIQGSIRGNRSGETVHPEDGNRFTVFSLSGAENSDKSYSLFADEWFIPPDTAARPQYVRTSQVVLPAACPPQQIDKGQDLRSATLMVPWDFTKEVAGIDGLKQQVCAFYPDKKGHIYGAFFQSDNWRPVPNSSVTSMDLANDELYGKEIRSLWTLVGITDGAPPCSINWPVWTSLHTPEVEPTELKFKTENISKTEVVSTYEDSYSLGFKIETKEEEVMSMDESFKYSKAFENKETSSSTVKTSLTTNFGLNEESQELGCRIWSVPQIRRISYQVYPWYDSLHPVINSLQYQFRTTGIFTYVENIEISEFPYLIDEPNAADLAGWKPDHRTAMYYSVLENDLSPLGPVSWSHPNSGPVFSFSEVTTTTTSVTDKNSYEYDLSMGVRLPEVFDLGASMNDEVSYSTENTYETEFGTELEISLSNLISKQDGINLSYYDFGIYWFKPNEGDWWYLDSLDGQKPWYIAYMVGTVHSRIVLLSPGPGSTLRVMEMLFRWKAEEGELGDYSFFISTDPHVGPATILYESYCGDQTAISLEDFTAEPGKTYYWAVRGMAPNGEAAWSESRPFILNAADEATQAVPIKAEIYPNPATGSEIYLTYEIKEEGTVYREILDIKGQVLLQTKQSCRSAGVHSEILDLQGLTPGVYLLVIRADTGRVVKKLVVGN